MRNQISPWNKLDFYMLQFQLVHLVKTIRVYQTVWLCSQLNDHSVSTSNTSMLCFTIHTAVGTSLLWSDIPCSSRHNKWSSIPKQAAQVYLSAMKEEHNTLPNGYIVLYEVFVPEPHHKYLYLNYQMSETYWRYNDLNPDYLLVHPHEVIIHCLERKSSSRKYYNEDDILTKDTTCGKFTIQGLGKVHTIDFGAVTSKPSCTCPDWLQWHIPCKHFFNIFISRLHLFVVRWRCSALVTILALRKQLKELRCSGDNIGTQETAERTARQIKYVYNTAVPA